ncbi:MAG: glycoside hydrolase family 2 [Lachnospiraceae bacterium]|nr:glycoside hydrolase family 2 [Lachnospiraceae bacterium]
MRIKDALSAITREKIRQPLAPLSTVWSEQADDAHQIPLAEYPRPQFVRENWQCLNGWWDYAIRKAGSSWNGPDGKILVPFSPETARSGVRRILQPGETLWYRRKITVSEIPENKRLRLHFGAVDERCVVWWNKKRLGSHRGGYLPFQFDVTDCLRTGENEIMVYVRDDTDAGSSCRGKQKLKPGGMFYTPQSGIWQTVWLEWIPENAVEEITLEPHLEQGEVKIRLRTGMPVDGTITVGAPDMFSEKAFPWENAEEKKICLHKTEEGRSGFRKMRESRFVLQKAVATYHIRKEDFGAGGRVTCHIPLAVPRAWSPETPYLYPIQICLGEDEVFSYFAMRSFSTGADEKGNPCLMLNGEPYFHHGVLDQGYWPETLMTPPADEAMIFDIRTVKVLGFNMIRKHAKVEPLRWYCHCDRLGMLVWQDMPNGGGPINALWCTYAPTALPFLGRIRRDTPGIAGAVPLLGEPLRERKYRALARDDAEERTRFEKQLHAMIDTLRNAPCVAMWVPFNEGWGQFDAARIAERVKHQDPARTVDHASGWFDQGAGEVRSVHNYFRTLKVEPDQKGRPCVLSEYGGLTSRIPGHTAAGDSYGYRDVAPEDLPGEFDALMREIRSLKKEGLAAAVYTQVSDIEEEINGLLTYDRKVRKVPMA